MCFLLGLLKIYQTLVEGAGSGARHWNPRFTRWVQVWELELVEDFLFLFFFGYSNFSFVQGEDWISWSLTKDGKLEFKF